MKALTQLIDSILEKILVVLFGIMILVITWQVFSRFVLNSPSSFTEELSTYILIWISLLGATYAFRKKSHIGIDILTNKLSEPFDKFSKYIIHFANILFFSFVFVWGGLHLVMITLQLNQISASLKIKIGYIYFILPISGLLMIYYSIYFLLNDETILKEPRHNEG
ncbi:MAG: TRAP transporter small permease [Flavobacteriales bacterium TMED235]|nr:MAG: TRAP transporter small permease [Flavobacteriales bacterium TMED235]|tara:strand:+ start:955 stop:1452 length:498 start_codon:yes stop_codon:yes gene_type:complete